MKARNHVKTWSVSVLRKIIQAKILRKKDINGGNQRSYLRRLKTCHCWQCIFSAFMTITVREKRAIHGMTWNRNYLTSGYGGGNFTDIRKYIPF